MKKYWPLILAVLCITLFSAAIVTKQLKLSAKQSIYIELQPVDPRSILQGDYMALRYDLYWTASSIQDAALSTFIEGQPSILAYVELDAENRVVRSAIDPQQLDQQRRIHPLKLKNVDNRISHLYPSTQGFFFAEDLEACYADAKYAAFKVDPTGNAILASLRDENLKTLACEGKRAWWQGSAQDAE